MAKFSRIAVTIAMKETGIIPVFYHEDIDLCKEVLKACHAGGIRVFEFTNRGDFAHEVFSELNKYARAELPEMILGIGSVSDQGTASLYLQLGANFVVSPNLNPEIARICNRRKVAWLPGCGTPTEIAHAEELGAEVIKIFPGRQVGGPEFVRALKGPCPWTSIMPTGGVEPTEPDLKAWFTAGVHCVGLGSQLITGEIIKSRDFSQLTQKIRQVIAMAKKYQNSSI